MKEKLTIHELVARVMEETGATRKLSEELIHALPEIIENGLIKDGSVKINGLGTFKLKWVKARVGRNLKTGERIEILPHNKVIFTPDAKLKDHVNKDFKFLTYRLLGEKKQDTTIAKVTPPAIEIKPKKVEEVKPPVILNKPEEVKKEPVAPPATPPATPPAKPPATPPVSPPVTPPITPPVKPPPKQEDKPTSDEKKPTKRNVWLIPTIIFIVLVLLVIFYFRTCRQQPAADDAQEHTEQTQTEKAINETVIDTAKPETPPEIDEPVKVESPLAAYQIEKIHQLKKGEYFYHLAREHYIEPYFWVLIYKANFDQIDNPDELQPGMTLIFPALEGHPDNLTRSDSLKIHEGFKMLFEYYQSQQSPRAYYFRFAMRRYNPD